MTAMKKKVHPFIARMQYEADIRGISDEELAAAMQISESALHLRKDQPNDLSVGELIGLAKKLDVKIIITASGNVQMKRRDN